MTVSPSFSPSPPSTHHHLIQDSRSLSWLSLYSRPFSISPPTSLNGPGYCRSLTDNTWSYLLMLPGAQGRTPLPVAVLSSQPDAGVPSECVRDCMDGSHLALTPRPTRTCISSCPACHAVSTSPHQRESFVIALCFLFLWALWRSECVCVIERLGKRGRERKLEGVPIFSTSYSLFYKIKYCNR